MHVAEPSAVGPGLVGDLAGYGPTAGAHVGEGDEAGSATGEGVEGVVGIALGLVEHLDLSLLPGGV